MIFEFVLGVYFADMSSKSANYCWPSYTNNIGLLLLCEVAIGSPNELKGADYSAASLPSGKNSVKGLGRCVPDPSMETRDHLYKDRSSRKTDSLLANRFSGSPEGCFLKKYFWENLTAVLRRTTNFLEDLWENCGAVLMRTIVKIS